MIFKYNEETELTDIEFDEDDCCTDCEYADVCPLLAAIQRNVVYASSNPIIVSDCGMLPNCHEEM